jgi:glycerol uptake facilitator-like aquaporin
MEVPHGDKFMIATILCEFFAIIGYSLAVNLNDGTHVTALIMFTMILCISGISGGHINPALTLGVYIERNKFCSYACWALSIMIAQLAGAIVALGIGWLIRVLMPADGKGEAFYFVPG